MRHHNPKSTSCTKFFHDICVVPYEQQYIDSWTANRMAKATPKKTYVKVLQYVADHDSCTRCDIVADVLGKHCSKEEFLKFYRGQHSNMFSQLLYLDLLDYDKNYKYHIHARGIEVLRKAYANGTIDKCF